MERQDFEILSDKLDKIIKLLALLSLKDVQKEQTKIELLDSLGFRPIDIARILGKTPANISVVLGTIRKSKSNTGAN